MRQGFICRIITFVLLLAAFSCKTTPIPDSHLQDADPCLLGDSSCKLCEMEREDWREAQPNLNLLDTDEGRLVEVPLARVRYTQASVSSHLSDGTPLMDIVERMKRSGFDRSKDPPDMVQFMTDDNWYVTLDHRRVVAAVLAGLNSVAAMVHQENDNLPRDQIGRFRANQLFNDSETGRTYSRGSIARTWGEAVLFRASCNARFGVEDFPLRGSPTLPKIRD